MNSPLIVFCTTCRGRLQHLQQTLAQNLKDNTGSHCKFVILSYGDPDLDYYMRRLSWTEPHPPVVFYQLREAETFRMAHAKNLAHRCGILEGADVLVNLDADNFTGSGFAAYLADEWKPGTFMWGKMEKGVLPRGIQGRIAVSRNAFQKSGGYDERFDTWSPDDKDFNLRLQRLGYEGREIEPRFLKAILHNDKMRFKEYRHVRTGTTDEEFEAVHSSETTVANFGKIGLGTVYRNFDRHPIQILPQPTRIWGIGMHKTATTSLHHALQILGYESAHWKSAHWAKAIWDEMHAEGRSLTAERHYAVCDLPVTLLYRELDQAYPGSKFILTVRNEESWIRSVENHWSHERNPFRASWNTDPFTHRIHKALYGQKGFNTEIFLARYRQHNADVRQYFRKRPDDLLVMDMSRGAGWAELCSFLKCKAPQVPYPKEFITR